MAELKSNLTAPVGKSGDDRVRIVLEENDAIPPTGLFVGDNGTGYMLVPGVPMDVPPGVLEILDNAMTAVPTIDPQTLEVVGYRPKKMYPFSRV
jgi:hypothetical protein